ncbi:hypothetical protein, partial [Enterococcus gallinarum]|uniref:hypothetical protein n=1 Tax=Enterococcus gallinarum TaxID=1353 RepID=UPI003DA4E44A
SKFLTFQKYLELIKDLKYINRNINQVIEVEMSEKDELSAEVMIKDLSLIARKLPSMEAISKIIPDISKLVPSILEINKIMTPTIEVIRKTVIPTFEVTRKLVEPYNEYMKHVNFDNNFNIPDKYLEDETRPTDNLTGDDDDDNLKDNE